MFGSSCGFTEWLVIVVVAIICFGPKGLPDMARKLGRFMAMVRRASDEFKAQIMAMDQQVEETISREIKPLTDAVNESAENSAEEAAAEPEGDPPLPPGPEAYEPTYEGYDPAYADVYPELSPDAPTEEGPLFPEAESETPPVETLEEATASAAAEPPCREEAP